jgi:5-methylthioadenosine/S-adenosylhomocysteine deaminase
MNENMEIIENGCIIIKDDKMVFVGIEKDFDTQLSALSFQQTIDARHKVIMPGLINTHTHAAMSLLRNYADDLALEDWLNKKIFPAEEKLTPASVYWGSMLSIIEMIRTGTTCFADQYFFMEEVAKAVNESGIRANLSRGLLCFDMGFDPKTDMRLLETRELHKNWHNKADGRIKISVAPHSVYTCIPKYLHASAELAKELGVGIHIHLAETKFEADQCIKVNGRSVIEHCNNMGIFDVPTIGAHCIHLSDLDIEIMSRKKVNAANNPGSNLKLASGIARVPEMIKKGVNVSLGTDGPASNNNLDMFEELRLATLISKGYYMDPLVVDAAQGLRMATVNGAKTLGIEKEVGQIKAGMKADLIILDTNRPQYVPDNNMISALAYSSNSTDVETVIVNGKVLMENRELKTIDQEKVFFEASKEAKRLVK